jgi:predicted nucleic acid-binding Zn ribbon protein
VWQVVPGGFCLFCTGAIDIYRAQVDLMTGVEKRRHLGRGYGIDETAPSVIFLNTLVASLAVQEFLNLLAPFKRPSPMLAYNALTGEVESMVPPAPNPHCPVCSAEALHAELPAAVLPDEFLKSVPTVGPAEGGADSGQRQVGLSETREERDSG